MEKQVKLTEKQTQCWDAFWNPAITSILYGGALGGGKTFIGCLLLFYYANWAIEEYKISLTKYPIPLGFMGRNRAVDFTKTTLELWKRIIPQDQYYIRDQPKEIIIQDKIKYHFGGLDREEDVSKFSSAEYAIIFIDQAEECDRDKLAMLRSRKRLVINSKELLYKELFTANPRNCWLKDEFVLGNDPKKVYIPALPKENPYLPKNYLDSVQEAFKHRPEQLLAFLEGSWDSLEGADIVIKDIWLRDASNVVKTYVGRPKRVFGVDVARFGDDTTVCYCLDGTDIESELIFGQKDTMYTAGKIHIWAMEKKPDLIGIDVIGLGAGVADRLREMGDKILEVNSAEKAGEEEKYYNLRAEMWWNMGRRFSEKDIKLTWKDAELHRELSAVSYLIRNGKILIEPKDKIKERLGRSPDKADAYIIGLHALDNAVIEENFDWEEEDFRGKCSPYVGL
ncbi:MAG: hypothetical protein PHS33_08750 [Candidatus Omnitrophica bacterium]|nr:hypothetical protein [Candidatus Omnitrophota bacterium]MDD5219830.1 hypothetical protein [Candidatus Bipolaricaulis sp.]